MYSIEEFDVSHKDTILILGEWHSTRKKYTYSNEMQLWLPPTMKAKLVTWVPVQKGRVYSGVVTWRMVASCLKDHLPFLLKPAVLTGRAGRGLLFPVQLPC